jgi:putative mRNA 3-end processing factor
VSDYPIDVSSSGTVLLGPHICCDGFHYGLPVRVQTHVHLDHMDDFNTSKGYQHILLSDPTRALLIAEFNADLPYRENVRQATLNTEYEHHGCRLTLVSSGHMLGAVQVKVELEDGTTVGYSGDFHWPLDDPIQVEGLVVDSTYGSPDSVRNYSQDEAEDCFLELVLAKLRQGPVHVKANRGTIQRALNVLSGNVGPTLLGSPRLCRENEIYQQYGYGLDSLVPLDSPEGRACLQERSFVRLYGRGDVLPIDPTGSTITLSAYMSNSDTPLLQYSERAYRVALSNHADFEGTMAYVEATGASYVVTDNTRGPAVELAREIKARLGVPARPSSTELTYAWGE